VGRRQPADHRGVLGVDANQQDLLAAEEIRELLIRRRTLEEPEVEVVREPHGRCPERLLVRLREERGADGPGRRDRTEPGGAPRSGGIDEARKLAADGVVGAAPCALPCERRCRQCRRGPVDLPALPDRDEPLAEQHIGPARDREADDLAARDEPQADKPAVLAQFGIDDAVHAEVEAHWRRKLSKSISHAASFVGLLADAKKALAAQRAARRAAPVGSGTVLALDPNAVAPASSRGACRATAKLTPRRQQN
jgi:hypothetical protein